MCIMSQFICLNIFFFPTEKRVCFTWISPGCSFLELADNKCRRQIQILIPALQTVYSEMQGDAWGELGFYKPELGHSSIGTLQRPHVCFLFADERNNSTHVGSEGFSPVSLSAFTSVPALQRMHRQSVTYSMLVQSFLYFFPSPDGFLNFSLHLFNGKCTPGHGNRLQHPHLLLGNINSNLVKLKRNLAGISRTNNH